MKVRFYATLREVVGARSVDVDVPPGMPVSAVLERLFDQHPTLEPKILDAGGGLRRAVNIFVNGRSVRFLQGLDTELAPDDDLAIFPPVAGG
jgi:molybdopterin synthase sulfur carrier subunit